MAISVFYNLNLLTTALDNAGVFNGENQGFGWSTHFKQNSSANLSGYLNPLMANINVIRDNDGIDAMINDQDITKGIIRQSL